MSPKHANSPTTFDSELESCVQSAVQQRNFCLQKDDKTPVRQRTTFHK